MDIIRRAEVEKLVTPAIAIEAMRHAFLALHRGHVAAPDEFVMHHPVSGDVHIKGAHVHQSRWMVAKIATAGFAHPGNHGCLVGINAETGKVEILVDDDGILTELRTAAAVSVSVDLLARKNSAHLAIIGSGVQAGYQLESLRQVRSFTNVVVAGRTPGNVERFAEKHGVHVADSVADAVADADVVVCATTSKEEVITASMALRPGAHITSSGADMVGKIEVGSTVIRRADIVAVDDLELGRRVGLLQTVPECRATTIGALLDGAPTRTGDTQLTIAGLCGLGVQDAAIFSALLDQLA